MWVIQWVLVDFLRFVVTTTMLSVSYFLSLRLSLFPGVPIDGRMRCVVSWVWFPSLTAVFLKAPCVVVSVSISPLIILDLVSIHSSMLGIRHPAWQL